MTETAAAVPARCSAAWRLYLAWGKCRPKTEAHDTAGAAYIKHIHSCPTCLAWLAWLHDEA